MTPERCVRTSKFLSPHLRHRPERLGLVLEPGGWGRVDELLTSADRHGYPISLAELKEVVTRNDEQRFGLAAARTRSERWLSDLGYSVARAGRTAVITTSAGPP